MKPVLIHHPGEPSDPEPPDKLIELAGAIRDPLVRQSGVTTTADGRWALYVTVPRDTVVPIPSVESQAGKFPVVYEAEPEEPLIAGPAYPTEGRTLTQEIMASEDHFPGRQARKKWSDAVSHFVLDNLRARNVTLSPGKELTIKALKAAPSPVRVDCNIHPWMKAYLFVFDHPYFAVTDENGQFEIKLAPAGNYRLVIWQDMGWKDGNRTGTPITIKADEVTDMGKVELKGR